MPTTYTCPRPECKNVTTLYVTPVAVICTRRHTSRKPVAMAATAR